MVHGVVNFFTFASVLPLRCALLLRETFTSFTAISVVGSPGSNKETLLFSHGAKGGVTSGKHLNTPTATSLLLVSIIYVSVIIYVITQLRNGDWAFKLPLIQRAGKKSLSAETSSCALSTLGS